MVKITYWLFDLGGRSKMMTAESPFGEHHSKTHICAAAGALRLTNFRSSPVAMWLPYPVQEKA